MQMQVYIIRTENKNSPTDVLKEACAGSIINKVFIYLDKMLNMCWYKLLFFFIGILIFIAGCSCSPSQKISFLCVNV